MDYDQERGYIITEIEAKDDSGVAELITVFQSPSGDLIPSIARKEIAPGVWQVVTDIEAWRGIDEGTWTLAGVITKDGAGNWVLPSLPGLESSIAWTYMLFDGFSEEPEYPSCYLNGYLTAVNSQVQYLPYDAFITGIGNTYNTGNVTVRVNDPLPSISGLSISSVLIGPGQDFEVTLYLSEPEEDIIASSEQLALEIKMYEYEKRVQLTGEWNRSGNTLTGTFQISEDDYPDPEVQYIRCYLQPVLKEGETPDYYSNYYERSFWLTNQDLTIKDMSPRQGEVGVKAGVPFTVSLTFNGLVIPNEDVLFSARLYSIDTFSVTAYTYDYSEFYDETVIEIEFDGAPVTGNENEIFFRSGTFAVDSPSIYVSFYADGGPMLYWPARPILFPLTGDFTLTIMGENLPDTAGSISVVVSQLNWDEWEWETVASFAGTITGNALAITIPHDILNDAESGEYYRLCFVFDDGAGGRQQTLYETWLDIIKEGELPAYGAITFGFGE